MICTRAIYDFATRRECGVADITKRRKERRYNERETVRHRLHVLPQD